MKYGFDIKFLMLLFIHLGCQNESNQLNSFEGIWVDRKSESHLLDLREINNKLLISSDSQAYLGTFKDGLVEIYSEPKSYAIIDTVGNIDKLIIFGQEFVRLENVKGYFFGRFEQVREYDDGRTFLVFSMQTDKSFNEEGLDLIARNYFLWDENRFPNMKLMIDKEDKRFPHRYRKFVGDNEYPFGEGNVWPNPEFHGKKFLLKWCDTDSTSHRSIYYIELKNDMPLK